MELVVNLPKPDGFFDPEAPAGRPRPPRPPEPEENEEATPPEDAPEADAAPAEDAPDAPSAEERRSRISYSNSDIAFSDTHMFVGNYHGFNTYSLEDPRALELLVSVVCPGGQGDVSVYGDLLFMSVQATRGRIDCGTEGVEDPVSNERFRGVRIFDISDIRNPQQIAAVQTCRGSHTHTLVPDPNDPANLYVYGSGTSSVRSGDELAGCVDLEEDQDPNENPDVALFSIDVIQVPLAAPETARIRQPAAHLRRPRDRLHRGALAGRRSRRGDAELANDDPVPRHHGLSRARLSRRRVRGQRPSFWTSPIRSIRSEWTRWSTRTSPTGTRRRSTTTARRWVFTDEWGGGGRPRCLATDLPTWGADAIFDIVDRKLVFRSYYKMPAPQTELENCVAHNGSLIPVPGRDIMVQSWYQGGISVFDFTDSANPIEIAFFDRGPLDSENMIMGGYWSSYWYNGYIYAAEISRGVDVFALTPGEHLSQNEIDASNSIELSEFNVQQQVQFHWPASAAVARAYVDQLTRSHNIRAAHATAVDDLLDRLDQAEVLDEIDTLAGELESDAAVLPAGATRLRALAETLRGVTTSLR